MRIRHLLHVLVSDMFVGRQKCIQENPHVGKVRCGPIFTVVNPIHGNDSLSRGKSVSYPLALLPTYRSTIYATIYVLVSSLRSPRCGAHRCAYLLSPRFPSALKLPRVWFPISCFYNWTNFRISMTRCWTPARACCAIGSAQIFEIKLRLGQFPNPKKRGREIWNFTHIQKFISGKRKSLNKSSLSTTFFTPHTFSKQQKPFQFTALVQSCLNNHNICLFSKPYLHWLFFPHKRKCLQNRFSSTTEKHFWRIGCSNRRPCQPKLPPLQSLPLLFAVPPPNCVQGATSNSV